MFEMTGPLIQTTYSFQPTKAQKSQYSEQKDKELTAVNAATKAKRKIRFIIN